MGQVITLPIANGFYQSESLPISAQECTNWYPNLVQGQGLSNETLFGTPGLNELANTGVIKQINRGSHVKNSIPYFVNGDTLYRLDRTITDGVETFTTAVLGVITGSGRVFMSDNGAQLIILVPSGDGFIYNEDAGTPFQTITDLDFKASGNPLTVKFIDGYFVFTTDTKKVIASALNDGLSYNALDFASAESDPDRITGQVIYKNQQFVIGTETTEVFSNQGAATGYPLTNINDYVFDKGSNSPNSIIKTSGSFMMIGGGVNESPAIWQFAGNGFTKISTTAIDNLLQRISDIELAEAFAFNYGQKGAFFTCFTFGSRTLCYDEASQRWHERKSFIDEYSARYRVNSLVTAYGRVLVGDSIDGRIGELDVDVYTEYGEEIRRVVASANFSDTLQSKRVSSIELTVESGVGNEARTDPQISMDYSDDGGKTFAFERSRSMGKIGEYNRRAIWHKNGRFPRFRVIRFHMSDPVKPVIISLVVNLA